MQNRADTFNQKPGNPKHPMPKNRTKLIIALLLPLQYIAYRILRHFPQFIETYYSQGVYPVVSKTVRYFFGWLPFSVGDVFYVITALLALRWLYFNLKRLRRTLVAFVLDIAAALSLFYFVFHLLWGLNYYRLPLNETLGLQRGYTTEALVRTTEKLIEKSNALHRELGYPDSVKIDLPYSQNEIFEKAVAGYAKISKQLPQFQYTPPSIKKSGASLGLTYMGYSGYYNPFSGEAQVNNLIKSYKFPVVSAHEIAHQLGYAAENEANFIAVIASINNTDTYIKYTGYIFALRYCISEIARRDRPKYDIMVCTINPGILESYREMQEFWASYESPIEDVS
ncbi:MAG: DUF3810 domain-containing protein, partial [Marinirhabdus sp.]